MDPSRRAFAYRPDIDGLRALAVLAVVVFHAWPAVLSGGFVGVDVFFVISGFLITGIIKRAVDDHSFSLVDFYARRLRRILPALLVVLVASLAVGYLCWLSDEWQVLGQHTFAGALFHANIALADVPYGNYFVALSQTTPLLHLWSLGVEEQFYLVWPLLFAALVRWTRWPLVGLIAMLLASFAVSLFWLPKEPMDAYYLPQARLWELLIGAALVLWQRPLGRLSSEVASLVGLALIVGATMVINPAMPFPGWWAWLPTAGTALVIAGGAQASINRVVLSSRPVVWVGLISYPLYLWHWPVLVFGRAIWNDARLVPGTTLLVLVSVVLAALTYRFIERHVRHGRGMTAPVLLLAGICAVAYVGNLAATNRIQSRLTRIVPSAPVLIHASTDWIYPFADNFRRTSEFVHREYNPGQGEAVLFIGDSYLEQYWPRVRAVVDAAPTTTPAVRFFTRGGCAPLRHEETRGPLCLTFLDEALVAAADPRVQTVVFGGFWEGYFRTGRVGEEGVWPLIDFRSDAERQVLDAFGQMIRDVRARGKRVFVLLSSPTDLAFDPRRLVSRITGEPRIQPVPLTQWRNQVGAFRQRFAAMVSTAGATVLDPLPFVCDGDECPVISATGEPTHTDRGHMRPWFVIERATFLDQVLTLGASRAGSAADPADLGKTKHTPSPNR